MTSSSTTSSNFSSFNSSTNNASSSSSNSYINTNNADPVFPEYIAFPVIVSVMTCTVVLSTFNLGHSALRLRRTLPKKGIRIILQLLTLACSLWLIGVVNDLLGTLFWWRFEQYSVSQYPWPQLSGCLASTGETLGLCVYCIMLILRFQIVHFIRPYPRILDLIIAIVIVFLSISITLLEWMASALVTYSALSYTDSCFFFY